MHLYSLEGGMQILDNGCGRGEFLHAFSPLEMIATGTDISDFCPETQIVDLNDEPLPFPDDCPDAVFPNQLLST